MKLSTVTLFFVLTAFSFAWSESADVEFRGVLDLDNGCAFSLSTSDGSRRGWVEEGESFAGYEVVEFRAEEKALLLRKDGEEYSISLAGGQIVRGEILEEDMLNMRQIGQAALIFANDNEEELPGGDAVRTIHDVARLLAERAGLNDASMWVSESDVKSGSEGKLTQVLNEDKSGFDPSFADQNIVAVDFATGLTLDMPSWTPIAWTRGLREDGTWDKRGTDGSEGGYVVFMGGNIDLYKEDTEFIRPDGTRTRNILEALPPEARVVGSGPGTLHGSTGVQAEARTE